MGMGTKQPEWLNYRRCVWIDFCDNCKTFIVEKKLAEERINAFLCSACRSVLIKHGVKDKPIKGTPKVMCMICENYFIPKNYLGQKKCDRCKGIY